MNPETHILYSRLTLLFVFISFWLATPEIIGENRLKAIGLSSLSSIIRLLLAIGIFGSTYILAYVSDKLLPRPFTLPETLTLELDILIPLVLLLVILVIILYIFVFVINVHRREDEILSDLFYNKDGRRTLLKIGALLFVMGAVFQLLAI